MNEHIKQLLSDAKIYDGTSSLAHSITTCPQYLEKFAELIIQECVDILDTFDCQFEIETMKQHFGAKE